MRIRLLVVFVLTEKSLLVALVVLIELTHLGTSWIAVAYLIAGTVRFLLVALTVFAGDHLTLVPLRFMAVREVLMGSLPFALSTASLNVIPRLDSFVLLTLSATSAGYFATGERVLGPALLVPVALSTTLYPFLSREKRSDRSVHAFAALLATAGLALAVVGAMLAPVVVPWIFGEQYRSSVPVVQVMLFVLPFVYASNPVLAYLYIWGREYVVLRVTIFASLLGTAMIVLGQVLVGPTLAASGLVIRQVVIFAALITVERATARARSSATAIEGHSVATRVQH
jgi:O-antigen/teichoic acid export membrane protein